MSPSQRVNTSDATRYHSTPGDVVFDVLSNCPNPAGSFQQTHGLHPVHRVKIDDVLFCSKPTLE